MIVSGPEENPAREVLRRLLSTLSRTGDVLRWDLATPYLLRHAVEHAARAGRLSLLGLLGDDEYLVNADPASVTAVLPPFRDVFPLQIKEILDVYCASVGWHQSVDARARRQILALDAVRLGHGELAARMRRTPGGRPLPWQCSWSTAANVSAASGATMTGHAGRVLAMAVGEFEQDVVAITGSDDRTARVWDLRSALTRHVLLHSQPVTAVAAATTNGRPALFTAAAGLTRWDPRTGRVVDGIADLPGVLRIDVDDISGVALAATRSSVLAVDVGDEMRVRRFTAPVNGVVDFTAIGREDQEAFGLAVTRDGRVTAFSLDDGRVRHRTRFREGDRITSFTTADVGGQTVAAVGCESGSTVVFHAFSGQALHGFVDPAAGRSPRRQAVRSLALFASGTGWRLATGHRDGTLRTWELGSGALSGSVQAHANTINVVTTGRVAGTDVFLTASDDDTVRSWDMSSGAPRAVFAGHTSGVTASALTRVGLRPVLVTTSKDRSVRTWDARGDQVSPDGAGHPRWIRSLELHRIDGRPHIVTACFDDAVRVIDAVRGETVRVLRAPDKAPLQTASAITIDGRTQIAAGGLRGLLVRWDFETSRRRHRREAAPDADIAALAFLPDGRVVSGDNDGVVTWWPVQGRPQTLSAERGSAGVSSLTVAGTSTAPLVVTGFHRGEARVFALSGSRRSRVISHPEAVRAVASNADGSLVAVGTGTEVHLHRQGRRATVLRGHTAVVRSLCVAPFEGEDAVFSGSTDGTVRVWHPATGEQLHRIDLPDIVQNVSYLDGLLAVGYGREIAVFTAHTTGTRGE